MAYSRSMSGISTDTFNGHLKTNKIPNAWMPVKSMHVTKKLGAYHPSACIFVMPNILEKTLPILSSRRYLSVCIWIYSFYC